MRPDDRRLRPVSSYIDFGARMYLGEIGPLTGSVLLVYLPVAAVALLLHPPVRDFVKAGAGVFFLFPRMFAAQILLRLAQVFLFILLIQKLEARRRGEPEVWDVAAALGRLKHVAAVDFAYAFGLQVMAVGVLWVSLTVAAFLFGPSGLALPLAFSITAFLVIAPAVRFYFCSLFALLHGTGFAESFRRAAIISSGIERKVVSLIFIFLMVWFAFWQLVSGIFGSGFLGQLLLQAVVMATSVPYFFAGYAMFIDLSEPEDGGGDAEEGGGHELPPPDPD